MRARAAISPAPRLSRCNCHMRLASAARANRLVVNSSAVGANQLSFRNSQSILLLCISLKHKYSLRYFVSCVPAYREQRPALNALYHSCRHALRAPSPPLPASDCRSHLQLALQLPRPPRPSPAATASTGFARCGHLRLPPPTRPARPLRGTYSSGLCPPRSPPTLPGATAPKQQHRGWPRRAPPTGFAPNALRHAAKHQHLRLAGRLGRCHRPRPHGSPMLPKRFGPAAPRRAGSLHRHSIHGHLRLRPHPAARPTRSPPISITTGYSSTASRPPTLR